MDMTLSNFLVSVKLEDGGGGITGATAKQGLHSL